MSEAKKRPKRRAKPAKPDKPEAGPKRKRPAKAKPTKVVPAVLPEPVVVVFPPAVGPFVPTPMC